MAENDTISETTSTSNIIAHSDSLNSNIGSSNIIIHSESVATGNWNKPFWRSVFSSGDGTASTSRVTTFLIVMNVLFLVDAISFKEKSIPNKLMELGLFTALLICTIYTPAKISSIFISYFSKK